MSSRNDDIEGFRHEIYKIFDMNMWNVSYFIDIFIRNIYSSYIIYIINHP